MKKVKLVYDRKKRSTQTGLGKIEIRIYLGNGEIKFITVGTASPDTWEIVAQQPTIIKKVHQCEQVIKSMNILGEDMTIKNFNRHIYIGSHPEMSDDPRYFYKEHDQRQYFVDFCRDYLEYENLAKNSIKDINIALNSVEASGILNTLADLTPQKIRAYDAWLRKQNNKSDETIHDYHKKITKYVRILYQQEMIPSNPYNFVKIKRGTVKDRIPLSEDELIKIRDTKYIGRLERVRDLFIFMAYTGLSYCDMEQFNFKKMAFEYKKIFFIDYSRLKTGSNYFTPILPPAMKILKKYDYKLPKISNQKLNDYLHVIQADLKINKNITCHISRHSFATLMIHYDISMEKTQKMLGHKDIKITQHYAKLQHQDIVDSVEKLLKKLK